MTLSIAFQNAIVYGVNLADNIMVGGYSQTTLSGVALVNQIQFLLQMIVMGAGEGIVVLGARFWGQRDARQVKRAVGAGMLTGLAGAALLWAIVFFFPAQVLRLLTPELPVIEEGVRYMRIVCFTYLFFAVTNLLLAAFRSVESVRIGFYVSLSALVVNVSLNYVLIYGKLGFPALGGEGAAIATLISRIVEFAVVVIYLLKVDRKLHLRLRDLVTTDREMYAQYIRVSLPLILSQSMWGIAQTAQTAILGHIGDDAIAANSIAATVFSIVTVVIYGGASASAVVIGKTLGEGRREIIREYVRTLQVIYLLLGVATGLGIFFFKDIVIGFYNITDTARRLSLEFMTVLSVTSVGTAYQMTCFTGIIRGGGDTKVTLINDLIHMWLIVIPSAALSAFVFHFSPVVVFGCLKCDQILKCGLAAIWVNSDRWIKKI